MATENGHLDLRSLVNIDGVQDQYECGKLRDKAICRTDDKCEWNKQSKQCELA